jgi:hypothetical protein
MMYVVQKNSVPENPQWLVRARPTLVWGDKNQAMLFETRGLAQMAAQQAAKYETNLAVIFVPDPKRWRN